MFDEPSLGLAPALVQELFGTIAALNKSGLTVLLVEQNVAHSLKLADRGYVLENGRIALSGTGQALLNDKGVRHAYLGITPEAPDRASGGPQDKPRDKPERKSPFKPIELAPPLVERRNLPGGGFELFSPVSLRPYAPSLAHLLRQQAQAYPDRDFLAERDASGAWRRLTYAAASRQADAIAQALLDRGCSSERPLMILSGNGIDHALLTFGAYVAGVPAVPVSVAYSLMSQDYDKLRHVFSAIHPRVVYAASGKAFAKALAALDLGDCEVIVGADPPEGIRTSPLSEMLAVAPTSAVEQAFAAIGPDTVAKVLFTSGSTGMPKGVVNTHRMMCANQMMLEQAWPFVTSQHVTLVDWLPWNHTFGGNHNVNLTLAQGGTLYIDAGRPAPGLIEHTVRNLAEVSPTIYFNVPAGYSALLPFLEKDEQLARNFFADLKLIFYAGAALSQDLWDRLEAVSIRTTGVRVPMVSSWGSTETAPIATPGYRIIERAGVIGLPPPGVTLKLVPSADKLEVRVRGPNVFPGYWGRPGPDAGGLRRGRLLPHRRRGAPCRPWRPVEGHRVRRTRRGGLQAFDGHLGACRRTARRRACGGCTRPAGRRGRRPRPRLRRPARLAESRRHEGDLHRSGPAGRSGQADRVAGGARARALRHRAPQRGAARLLDADRARAHHDGAAVDRRQRDHRQGLHQSARDARSAARAGGAGLCRAAV